MNGDITQTQNAVKNHSAETPKQTPKPKKQAHGVLGKRTIYNINPLECVVNRERDVGRVDLLAGSIESNGLLVPLRVRRTEDKKFEVLDGVRRYRAVMYLIRHGRGEYFKLEGIPAIVEPYTKEQDVYRDLVERAATLQCKPLKAVEEAALYESVRRIAQISTVAGIAHTIGVPRQRVTDARVLLDKGIEQVIDALRAEAITRDEALYIIREAGKQKELRNEEKQLSLLNSILKSRQPTKKQQENKIQRLQRNANERLLKLVRDTCGRASDFADWDWLVGKHCLNMNNGIEYYAGVCAGIASVQGLSVEDFNPLYELNRDPNTEGIKRRTIKKDTRSKKKAKKKAKKKKKQKNSKTGTE